MKTLLMTIILGTLSSAYAQVNYSSSAIIAAAHRNIKITDVKWVNLPTKTEIRTIPGCNPNGEAGLPCEEVVVLERTPVVQAEVSYDESVFRDPDMPKGYITFNLDTAEFPEHEVAELKANSGLWDFTGRKLRARLSFAKKFLSLSTKLVRSTELLVDTRRSKLCLPHGESGQVDPNCKEEIVYKRSTTKVREVSVNIL